MRNVLPRILSFVVGCNAPSDPVVNSAAPSALSHGEKQAEPAPHRSLAQLAGEVHATDLQVVDTVGPGHEACAEPSAKNVTLSSTAQTWLAAVLEQLTHSGAPELGQVRLNVPQARLQQRLLEAAPNYHNAVSQGRGPIESIGLFIFAASLFEALRSLVRKERNPMKVHLSLPVSDIQKTRAFYSQLLRSAPSKEKVDYIKFEPAHLALNISFHVGTPKPDVHLGLQVTQAKELNSEHARLEEFVEGERDTSVCCYASQDKFWVKDPDGYRWEIYRLVADTEQKISSKSTCCQTDSAAPSSGPACC